MHRFTGPRTDQGRRLGIRQPWCCERAGGGGNRRRAAARGGEQRREAYVGLGCPIYRANHTGTTASSWQTPRGGRRGGGDCAGRRAAAGRGGATPATLPWQRGARQREQAAPTGPLTRGGTTGELDGGRKGWVHSSGDGGARIKRRRLGGVRRGVGRCAG
jgi:hypothetical protein